MMLETVEFSEGRATLHFLLLKRHPLLCLCHIFVCVWQSGMLLFFCPLKLLLVYIVVESLLISIFPY